MYLTKRGKKSYKKNTIESETVFYTDEASYVENSLSFLIHCFGRFMLLPKINLGAKRGEQHECAEHLP